MLFTLLKNGIILVILLGILFAVTRVSPSIKKQTDAQIAKVLGAKTVAGEKEKSLPEDLKKDAKDQAINLKERAMEVDLNDIGTAVGRLRQIPNDAREMIEGTRAEAEKFWKQNAGQ